MPVTWPASPGPTGATLPAAPGWPTEARRVIAVEGRAVFVGSVCAGLTEMLFRLRGFEDGYMDLAADPALARALMERVLEIKLAWWGAVLPELGDAVDVVGEADDLGGQASPLFSPRTYRELVKPLQAELFAFIRSRTRARILLPFVRRDPRADPRPHRDRGRCVEPRAGVGHRHGDGGAQARLRP